MSNFKENNNNILVVMGLLLCKSARLRSRALVFAFLAALSAGLLFSAPANAQIFNAKISCDRLDFTATGTAAPVFSGCGGYHDYGSYVFDFGDRFALYTGTPNCPRNNGVPFVNFSGFLILYPSVNIPVKPNTNYQFSVTAYNIPQGNPINTDDPILSFMVNGRYYQFSKTLTPGLKQKVYPNIETITGIWNSGSATSVTTWGLYNAQSGGCGNDLYVYGFSGDQVVTPPKIKIIKTALGATGTFAFDLTGTSVATDSIVTTAQGTPFTGLTTITGTVGTAIGISERPTLNFPPSTTSISCTDANAGNAVVASVTGGASVSIAAASVTSGADITCAVTNKFVPPKANISISKSANQPVLVAGATGQSYSLTVNVANNPTQGALTMTDNLPSGLTLAGAPTISTGSLTGCSASGTSIGACTLGAGLAVGTYIVTVPVNVTAPAASNAVSNSVTLTAPGDTCVSCTASVVTPVIDAVNDTDSQIPGVAASTNVGRNDAVPAGATFTVTGGSCANPSPLNPVTNTTGVLNYTLPVGSTNCTVVYALCAPAPNAAVCDSATLTVNRSNPTITVSKVLGSNRADDADQFALQISSNGSAVASSTTQGSGNTVLAGTGVINAFVANVGGSYTIGESMASGSSSAIGFYNSAIACSNASGTTLPSALDTPFTVQANDAINCTITNTPKPVTLKVRQVVISPMPPNLVPPFTIGYAGTNGWASQTLTSPSLNVFVVGASQTLAASNIATTLSLSFPDTRWLVRGLGCVDSNAASTGNPTGNLVSVTTSSVTLPAINVKPGAALLCTALLGHSVP